MPRPPTTISLAKASPPPARCWTRRCSDRPLILIAGDHHTAWANTIALDRAGILKGRNLSPGNEIVMGDDGFAAGELRESEAMATGDGTALVRRA